MTNQKALIGNEFCGIYLNAYKKLNASGFSVYLMPFMFSCMTVNQPYRKIQDISIGILGVTFTFSITHPWFTNENKDKS